MSSAQKPGTSTNEPKHDGTQPEIPVPMSSSQGMRSATMDQKPEKTLANKKKKQDDNDVEQPELPKLWGPKDPFIYAPPKPDRDPWSILLEPLMERDKIQCDAWKDEVQNLLIFAGLFSAVVTAFIIESYRTLKPDPNDTIILLLSVIANRLDNTTNFTPVFPSSTGPTTSSFSPTMSSIRVNIFWFISLVLSLTTVLIGIISLQWIREHQNYPNQSPKDNYALLNMRADGLARWHVRKIFTALPLLLQGALVLFLGGVVDFLRALDDIVVIPVSIGTAFLLLFLIATTVLPTFQSLLLYLPYPYTRTGKIPPPQCPYKSPQSHAFHVMISSIAQLYFTISRNSFWGSKRGMRTSVSECILKTFMFKKWKGFDIAWLELRDHFVRRSYTRFIDRGGPWRDDSPICIFDLTQALMISVRSREADLIQNSLSAQYHCFTEVSKCVIDLVSVHKVDYRQAVFQANGYLRDLMAYNHVDCSAVLSDCFNLTTSPGQNSLGPDYEVQSLLHQENMFLFLEDLGWFRWHDSSNKLLRHQLELAMRLSTLVHMGGYGCNGTAPWPKCLGEYDIVPHLRDGEGQDLLLWHWVNNLFTFFQGAARIHPPYALGGTLHTHPFIIDYMSSSGSIDLRNTFKLTDGLQPAIQKRLLDTFQLIADHLNEEMKMPDFQEPNLLFYLTALYLAHANRYPFHRSLDGLLSAMRAYKAGTIDTGVINHNLEEIFRHRAHDGCGPARFSPEWWEFLKDPRPGTGGGSISTRSHVSIREVTPPLRPDT